jgi:hypothetical protein
MDLKSKYYKKATIPGPVPGSACNLKHGLIYQTDPTTSAGIFSLFI